MCVADILDPNTTLVAGSVQTTQGTVTTANGDIQVALGTLPGGNAQATITFRVRVNSPLPAGVTRIANQGPVSATNAASTLTDDPDTLETNDTTITPVVAQPVLDATQDLGAPDLDADRNGNLARRRAQYSIVIRNNGNSAATAVQFTDIPDANTTLVAGSVQASRGTVTSGDTTGDTNVGVNIGTVAGGNAQVTVVFQVRINTPLAAGVTQVANQGPYESTNATTVQTDDPATAANTIRP